MALTGFRRHPEDVSGVVLISSGSTPCIRSLLRPGMHLLEGVGDVFQEDEVRTMSLYSAASIEPRKVSAMRHNSAS